jgi:UbiD family decarboxylase
MLALSFLTMEEKGLLLRVKKEVDRRFELAALIAKAQKLGKAILFENVSGLSLPVVSNVVGSRKMLALALDVDEEQLLEEYVRRSEDLIQPQLVSEGRFKKLSG